MNIFYGFIIAISFFTIIPMPFIEWKDNRTKYMLFFIPFVGLVIGIIGILVFKGINLLPINVNLKSVLFTAYFLVITGGVHFDGLMDTADAYFSRRDLKRKLEIMTDSRVGAFAVMTAILVLLLKYGIFTQLFLNKNINEMVIIFVPVLSRSLQITMLFVFPQAKDDGLAKMFGSHMHKKQTIFFYGIFALVTAFFYLYGEFKYVGVSVILLLFYGFYYFSTRKNFGGVTGDILGAFVELSEVIMWFLICLL